MDHTEDLEDESELLFDTPGPGSNAQTSGETGRYKESRFTNEQNRESSLKQELESVRKVNQVIENLVESLEKAKSNMHNVSHTVTSASTLLQSWSRILSQAEHNQRLILNPRWQGATTDLSEIENDIVRRQQEARRRQIEEQQRQEAAARKAEEDERKRAAGATRGTRGRGTSRFGARPTSTAGSQISGTGSTRGSGFLRGHSRAGSLGGRSGTSVGRTRGTRGRGATGS